MISYLKFDAAPLNVAVKVMASLKPSRVAKKSSIFLLLRNKVKSTITS